jgi:MFS family permease
MSSQTNTLAAFYLTGSLRELIPIYPLYAIMMGEHGISPLELSVLFSLWALVGVITEIPSGAWADTFSRKRLIVASAFIKGAAFLTWYLWQDFPGYALGFIFWGFGSSLRSGAWEALLYDSLKCWHAESRFTCHYGRMKALATLGVMAGEVLGGFLIIHGFDLVLLVSACVPVIATIPFIFLVDEIENGDAVSQGSYLDTLKSGVRETFRNRSILYIFLAFTLLVVAFGVIDEYIDPILFEKGFSLSQVAWLAVPIFLAQATGEAIASRFQFLSLNQLLACMALSTLFLFASAFLSGYWVAGSIAVFFFMFALANTLFSSQLQEAIEGSARATVTSTVSLGDGVGAIIWFMIFGSMAELTSMTSAGAGFAILTIFACGFFYLLGKRWNLSRHSQQAS